MRTVIALIVVVAMAAACSDDGALTSTTGSAASTSLPGETSRAPDTEGVATDPPAPSTSPEPSPDTTASPRSTTSTVAPTTTTTTLPPGAPLFALTRVAFALRPHVVVTNVGNGPGPLAGYWLCAEGDYFEIPEVTLGANESVIVSFGDTSPIPDVGVVEVFDASEVMAPIEPIDGEMALYRAPVFDDATQMVAYVEWGLPGHDRSDVAVAAGLWPAEAYVISSHLTLGMEVTVVPATAPADWFAEIGG